MRGLQRFGSAVVVALLWSLSITPVSAQALRGLRLRVDPTVVSYVSQTAQGKDVVVPGAGTVEAPKVTSTTLGFGLLPGGLALGIGGSVNNHVNLGINALLSIASATTKVEDGESTDSDLTSIALLPYAEYVFGETDAARGFIGVHAGLSSATVTDDAGEQATGSVGAIGVDAGLHYFLNEHVSLDPQVTLRYTAGSVEDVSIHSTSFFLGLGLSAWIGASKAAAAEAPTQAQATDEAQRPVQAQRAARTNSITRAGDTVSSYLTLGSTRVDLMADLGHPDAIALRFQRMTPTHRAPTIRCESWTIVRGEEQTAISPAVYRGTPSGPGIEETLKSHVPIALLRAIADETPVTGAPTSAFVVCGERLDINPSARANLITFLKRFDKMLELNGTAATPAAPTEATPAPESTDTAPEETAPGPTPSETSATPTPVTP